MRDSTYDSFKDEPPLDTVVKDFVFRIDPPDLLKVLQARLDYIFRYNKQLSATSYHLDNGIEVCIKRDEQIEYFKHLLQAIRNNRWANTIFYCLSDRNTRNGIQLFEDFCKSGHISSDEIFKARTDDGHSNFPSHKLVNALLRKNRRYFNGEKSNFVNLFSSLFSDDFPDPFVRIDILLWLKIRISTEGPNKTKGCFKISNLVKDLQAIGHDATIIFREIELLINHMNSDKE